MKLFKGLLYWLSQGFLTFIPINAGYSSIPRDQIFFNDQGLLRHGAELSNLPTKQFYVLSHPAFPGRSARIKKSSFCDGQVAAYTGYIDIGARHLFFYFFESRNDPDKDDVMLWTNGGPGGSSTVGMLMELGPCSIVDSNSTKFNPYSWNEHANIFFIDQPVGVGYSHADFDEVAATTEEAAKDIAAFIATFFETFSEFQGRGFHLSGESYAGRYLPVYAAEIYDQNARLVEKGMAPVNLKSVMIGNGATNFFHLTYSWYDIACTSAALKPVLPISSCVRMKQALPRCKRGIQQRCVDSLDLIDCRAAFDFCFTEFGLPYFASGLNPYDITKKCLRDSDLCYEEVKFIIDYINQPWVREEVGVDPSVGSIPSIVATNVYERFWDSGDHLHLNELYISELLEHGVRVLIYAGSYDWIANWVANERWTLEMEWSGQKEFRSQPLKEWVINGEPVGRYRSYGNLTFATIYSAGHMVPFDKPIESLEMLKHWLSAEEF